MICIPVVPAGFGGVFALYFAEKRNHISAAHIESDIDRALEAARDVLRSIRDDGLPR